MPTNDYTDIASFYVKQGISGTGMLVYRDIKKFITKPLNHNTKTLDFGCGAGRSTRLLQAFNLNVTGVDVSQAMLDQAIKEQQQSTHFFKVDPVALPFEDKCFDLIVSTLVLFEIDSLNYMQSILIELNRVLKDNGEAIFVTGSEHMHFNKWLTIEPLHDPSQPLNSGDKTHILLKQNNITLTDVFWKNADYPSVFRQARFKCNKTHFPIAQGHEDAWVNETTISPYVLYVLSK